MGREEYDITLVGPDGYVEFVSNTHEDCMDIVSDLTSASNGYHEVTIDPPQE